MRFANFLVVFFVVSLEARVTAAPSSSSSVPSPEDLYTEGKTAYDHGDYAVAVDRWQKSYATSGESDLLFNIAQAHRLAGDCAIAILIYKQFIAADPTADQVPLATSLIHELEPRCDLKDLDAPKEISNKTITVRRSRALAIGGLATGSLGAIAVVSGLLFGQHARTIGREVTAACAINCNWPFQKEREAMGRRSATVGYALDVIGGATLVAGTLMYYFGQRERSITVTPISPRGDGHGATVSWNTAW